MTSNAPSAGGPARSRTALLVPGVGYTPARPLLHYARAVLEQHGWDVRELWWEIPGTFQQFTEGERQSFVERQVVTAIEAEGCGLLVGKSLGTLAATIAADRALPAVWLTPLLPAEPVVRALSRAKAPTLLVGGTGDPLWDPAAVRELPHEVLEFADADHSLELPGDAVGSVALLQRLVEALDRFAEGVTRARKG
ncbi:alpha/beta hydrolase [Streptomyces sp. SBT349]|uniref:alpha/beta hydrolase n=1 Tax=Streptomyces sp. SBT349 TaxID=1580539 RepID=UPI00066E6951|nr:alpha/beta hydrolase [Streptomyces sp. SBT349]